MRQAPCFGLRRIGGNSVLWAVVRHLKAKGDANAIIDGNDTRHDRATWNEALFGVKEVIFFGADRILIHGGAAKTWTG